MPVLVVLNYLVAITFAVHAVRNRQQMYWVFILLMFPVLGSLVYFFYAIFPTLGVERHAVSMGRSLLKAVDPDRDMRVRIDEVALCGSMENKIALAEECMNRAFYHDAAKLYHDAMSGMYANDPLLGHGLGTALFALENYTEAKDAFTHVLEKSPNFKAGETRLYLARALEQLNEQEAALTHYEQLRNYAGEEARCREALLLQKLGRHAEAQRLFEETLLAARRSPAYYRRVQAEWIAIAKANRTT